MVVSLPVRSPVQSPVQNLLGRVSATFLDEMLAYGAIDAWDFTSGAYLRGGTYTGNPGLTVTRASEGYAETSDGRLVKFGSGVLRRTDKGILVEGARTNLLTYSQKFDDVAWTKTRASITADAIAAPDGTLTADTLTEDATASNTHFISGPSSSSPPYTVAATITTSIFVKVAAGTRNVAIRAAGANGSAYAIYNLSTGLLVASSTTGSNWTFVASTITALANGWYRITCTGSHTETSGGLQLFCNLTDGSSLSYTGDGTSGIYLWGAQLEAASFPSSYIPTEGSTVTRAADVVEATAAQTSPFSMYVEKGDTLAPGSSFPIPLNIDDGTTSNRAWFFSNGSNTFIANTSSGVFTQLNIGTWSATSLKVAGRWQSTNLCGATSGALSTVLNSTAPVGTLTQLEFGSGNGGQHIFGYLRRAAIIPSALTDTQLEEITTPGLPPLFASFDLISGSAQYAGSYYSDLSSIPGYSFTRASEAYYTNADGSLTKFNSGELRIGDQGVLIEGSRTNLLLYSQAFDDAAWTNSNVTVTANAIAAPDGTTTADLLTAASSTSVNLQQTASVAATVATASVFVKKGSGATEANTFRLRNSTTATNLLVVTVNYDTGAITYTTGSTGATMQSLGGGWWRLTLSASTGITSGDNIRFDQCFIGPATIGHSAYVWGAQLEAGAFPSSYIPTEGSTVTRAADVLTIGSVTGLDYPLSLAAEFERVVDTGGQEYLFSVSDGTSSHEASCTVSSGDLFQAIVNSTTQQMNATSGSAIAINTSKKAALRIATNDSIGIIDGNFTTLDTSVTLPATPNSISFGYRITFALFSFGLIRSAKIYSGALSDYWLKRITS